MTEYHQPHQTQAIGDILRYAREERQMSLEDISEITNIRPNLLLALEENRMDDLPNYTYVLGFVRGYAGAVGLDVAQVVAHFKSIHGPASKQVDLNFNSAPIEHSLVPDKWVIAGSVLALVLVIGVWQIFFSGDDVTEHIKDVPEALRAEMPVITETQDSFAMTEEMVDTSVADPVEETDNMIDPGLTTVAESVETELTQGVTAEEPMVEEVAVAPNPVPRAKPPVRSVSGRVVIVATGNSWVQITDENDQVILGRVLRPGDRYTVPERTGLTMVTGNAGGLKIVINGDELPAIGEQGDIIRGISLNPKDLLEKYR